MPITIPTQKQAAEIHKKKNRTIPQNRIWPTVNNIQHTQKNKPWPGTQACWPTGHNLWDPKVCCWPTHNTWDPQVHRWNSWKQQNSTDPGEHHCRIGCLEYLWDLLIHSLAAAYNNPATSTTRAHGLLPNQFTTSPVADSSQDTMDPITPGKAAAAFPARFASNLARLWSCFLTQSFTPSFDGGLGGVVLPPVVGITASTITPIIIPMAVRIITIVMPCSLNNVFSLSRRVVSSFKTLFIVSFILFIWSRISSLFALAASSRSSLIF